MSTTAILVSAETKYLEARSDATLNRFAFAYSITIHNTGDRPARLLEREWIVVSDNGKRQEIRGPGVIGQQPRLKPGTRFSYTSWVLLETPTGQMKGRYFFTTDDGETFWADVPPIPFAIPGERPVLH
ncbi:MAG: Co2+/Mg2+ efflux protein ApaG [Magnetococcales bacterium]|nr:Co2+/Mg2+ efflux protein ApaG [Magnetococcales bacterium]